MKQHDMSKIILLIVVLAFGFASCSKKTPTPAPPQTQGQSALTASDVTSQQSQTTQNAGNVNTSAGTTSSGLGSTTPVLDKTAVSAQSKGQMAGTAGAQLAETKPLVPSVQIAMIPPVTPTTKAGLPAVTTPSESSGTPSLTSTQPTAVASPVAPAVPEVSCFTITFQHKKLSSHNSEEICAQHKNLLKLKHDNVNKKTICVKVDGHPVRFEMPKKDEILIGSLAGPESKIIVRYCIGKAKCQEECKVPKDDFMEAIGGSADGDLKGQGQWGDAADEKEANSVATISKMEAELKKELIDTEESDRFSGWLSEGGKAPEPYTCGTKQAGKTTPSEKS